jgi:hypothetical protein
MEEIGKNSKMVKFKITNSNGKEYTESILQSNIPKVNECTNPALKIKQQYMKQKTKESYSNTKTDKIMLNKKHCKYILLETLSEKLSQILNDNIKEEKQCPEEFAEQNRTYFYSPEIPDISLKDYFKRLAELSKAEFSTCMLLSIYLDRFCENASFHLTWNTVYR